MKMKNPLNKIEIYRTLYIMMFAASIFLFAAIFGLTKTEEWLLAFNIFIVFNDVILFLVLIISLVGKDKLRIFPVFVWIIGFLYSLLSVLWPSIPTVKTFNWEVFKETGKYSLFPSIIFLILVLIWIINPKIPLRASPALAPPPPPPPPTIP